jgi:diaminopimelate epimerase
MNGLGNEILVVDLRGTTRVLAEHEVRAIAAAPETRFDQLMALHEPRSSGTAAYVRIYNADGSESGACGNGSRCIAWLEAQATGRRQLRFETTAGLLDTRVESIERITVDMGPPRFAWNEIPLRDEFKDTRYIELQIGPIDAPVLHSPSVVNVGNPHAVFWVDDIEAYDLARFGPLLENHPIFPERANISLAHVVSPTAIRLRTWERGVGLTRACGSAACAAAVCGARVGRTERKVTVTLPGGPLEIEWTAAGRILMTGPVEVEREGELTI